MDERDDLITEKTPQVIKTVRRYIRKNPAHRPYEDDMIGECLLKLIEVVDLFLDKKIDNFSGYLHQSIRRAISATLRDTPLIKTRSKNPPSIVFGGIGKVTTRPVPDMTYEEAFDSLLGAIKGPRDAKIFQARWDGLSIDETAERVGVSKQTVKRRLKKMKARYEQAAQD